MWHGKNVLAFVLLLLMSAGALLVTASAQAGSTASSRSGASGPLLVVVAENFWGSIVQQEAGTGVHVASIITNPNADPHSYEPTASDARLVATARFVIENGAGYDSWMQKLLDANPVKGRRVLNIGDALGIKDGQNPHIWYGPSNVLRVAGMVTSNLSALDRGKKSQLMRLHARFVSKGLATYDGLIRSMSKRYRGVPVGATESIFQYLAQALHLNLITPYSFMKDIAEGTEPTAQDRATVSRQIGQRQIKMLVFNSQNVTPDTRTLQQQAKTAHIPIIPITETLSPANMSFQAWQVAQLRSLQQALHRATGR